MFMEQITVIKTIDVTATLLNIPLNTTVFCTNSLIRSEIIRTIASRLKRQKKGLFIVSAINDGVSITRK